MQRNWASTTAYILTALLAGCFFIASSLPDRKMDELSQIEQVAYGSLPVSYDVFGGSLSALILTNKAIEDGRIPGWNPYVGMGRMLYADAYHYGLFNPVHHLSRALFPDDPVRQLALSQCIYTILLCCLLFCFGSQLQLTKTACLLGSALLLSSAYIPQGAGLPYAIPALYLALAFSICALEAFFKTGRITTLLLLAPPMALCLTTARADIYVYFGFICGLYTLSYLLFQDRKTTWQSAISMSAIFLILTVALTAVQLLPLKAIGAASARTVVHHTGYGFMPLAGLKKLGSLVFFDKWDNFLWHNLFTLLLALLPFAALKKLPRQHTRLLCFSTLGILLIYSITSEALTPILQAIGFDMQEVPYVTLVDIFLFCASAVGITTIQQHHIDTKRYAIYAIYIIIVSAWLFGAQPYKYSAARYYIVIATLFIVCIEWAVRNQLSNSTPLWTRRAYILPLAIITSLLIGNTPASILTGKLSGLFFTSKTTYTVGIAITIGLCTLCLYPVPSPNKTPVPAWKTLLPLALIVLTIMHIPSSRKALTTENLSAFSLPEEARTFYSSTNFRTLNVLGHDEEGLPLPYTYSSANYFLSFPMYAPMAGYLETSGGHSVAPKTASDFSDLINTGHLWDDKEHPRFRYLGDWIKSLREGKIDSRGGIIGLLQNLKKSVMVYNIDSPFLRYTATKYVVSSSKSSTEKHVTLVKELKHLTTFGRDVTPEEYISPYFVYEVKNTLPRVYIPDSVVYIEEDAHAAKLLEQASGSFAVVHTMHSEKYGKRQGTGSITNIYDTADTFSFVADMQTAGWVIVSDTFFPGWSVKINNTNVDIIKANIGFRAVYLEAGEHLVTFTYLPPMFLAGCIISLIAFCLCTGGLFLYYIKNKNKTQIHSEHSLPALKLALLIEDGGFFAGSFCEDILSAHHSCITHVFIYTPPKTLLKKKVNFFLQFGYVTLLKFATLFLWKKILRALPITLAGKRNSSVAKIAKHYRKKVIFLNDLNSSYAQQSLLEATPDIIFSSVTQILKAKTLTIPTVAFLNKHASLLPAYKGVNPIFRAFLEGETAVGMTVHQMTEKIDEGRILCQQAIQVTPKDTVWSLNQRAYALVGPCLSQALRVLTEGAEPIVIAEPQKSSYYSKLTPDDIARFKNRALKYI
ncbi:YfhO family protein [Desulfovibrio subterraneus]|uniref:formyltransferase family protein n=1 Tax=Desulfovibrio subterraneus TaxID=2718620 RepID=UPI0022B9198D|nr:formyltransferase family protein [Desulfovibrio subterraneus]WBF66271.1 YfhO family protein [Desulfovibrio subterraneus]